ncbi:MAG: CinA family nicotinamide mononucleotide deamidase-related protein [Bacteroidales bacterium]|nr:CinA family nicotinamide mononucleotide deamidase-related protein [Bacteroidales bacterium]MDD4823252.1 CinA family nicotinamide mononucleotide deamidase-related protein [Bacteroidales bacterium]
MNVEIITIGDEILIGQIVDTNSAWMAVRLNQSGFSVVRVTSVKDVKKDIIEAIDHAFLRADIVLMTGGIGPTKDDITKQTLCEYFGSTLVYSEEVYENIKDVLADRMRVINKLTRLQAMVPDNCVVVTNHRGTAPITWFEKEEKVLVSMPGVPYEMMGAMEQEIIPRLLERFPGQPFIRHKHFLVSGYSESALAEKLIDWESGLDSFLKLAYLPAWGIIRLRITGMHASDQLLEQTIEAQSVQLRKLLDTAIVSEEDISVEEVLGEKLKEKGLTLGVAESCTGGAIAQRITRIAGCSAYFKGSVVAYSNDAKKMVLKVREETLNEHGAVSLETVKEMATGAQQVLKSDCAVATSGIAGPAGGSVEKPVGTICVAAVVKDRIEYRTFHFNGGRENNIKRTVNSTLLLLLEMLQEIE